MVRSIWFLTEPSGVLGLMESAPYVNSEPLRQATVVQRLDK